MSKQRAWGIWMIGSLVSLFIHFPPLSVSASAEFALTLSAIAAILLGIAYADSESRKVDLRWLAAGTLVFIAYSAAITLPQLNTGVWTDAWGSIAWLGHSVCLAILLAAGTAAIVTNGEVNTVVLRNFLAIFIFLNLLLSKFTLLITNQLLPFTHADMPFGFFYNTRIPAFWSAIGLVISGSALIPAIVFLAGLVYCKSFVAWAVVLGFLLGTSGRENRIVFISMAFIALSCFLTQSYYQQSFNLIQLRIQNWSGALATILQNSTGIGTNPIAYNMALGHRNLLPNPTSDILFLALQYGWIVFIGIGASVYGLFQNRSKSAIWIALVCVVAFASVQTALHSSHNLMLAWMLLCAWLIERSENGKRTPEKACC